MDRHARGRRFSVTDGERIDWVPATTRADDLVCGFFGFNSPFCLRQGKEADVVK